MNYTTSPDIPPLPAYALHSLPPLVSWIPDKYLTLLLPIIAYWAVSLIFHTIDTFDLFPQYRLHTPEELLKRNHATRWDVLRDVILQHIIQTISGAAVAYFDPDPVYGKEDYDVAQWAQWIRLSQKAIPFILSSVGVNAVELAAKMVMSNPILAGVLAGGNYPSLMERVVKDGQEVLAPAFASWEIIVAKAIYWVGIPALQFLAAIIIVDTWQYFWHRGMHLNKTLYVWFHSRHHRLYVPYAYGALYNHPVEGFVLDTLGTGIAYLVTGMSVRQAMWFFTCSSIKTVDDHCGYALPFDPLQMITSNNAAYHDIHHQSWGIKTNFSQPFFTIWDRALGTMWIGDIKLRYERSKDAAKRAVEKDREAALATSMQSELTSLELQPNGEVISTASLAQRRSPRKKRTSISEQSGSLKGLRDRVNQNLQGKGRSVLGVESSR